MRALRALVVTLNVLAGVAVLVIGAIALVVSSETGSARIVAHVAERMAADIGIERIEGTLAGTLILHGVTLGTRAATVTADRAALAFSASSLFARSAVLNAVELNGVVWSGHAGAGIAGEAPLPVVVRRAAADALTLRRAGGDIELRALQGSGRWVGRRVVVDELRGETPDVSLTGRGEVDWADGVRLDAVVNWAGELARADGAAEAGDAGDARGAGFLTVTGRLPALELRHELLSPVELTAAAQAAVSGNGTLDLDRLALGTDHGTLMGRGRLALDTTVWELTLDARGAGSPPAWTGERERLRLTGRLLPRIEWRAGP